MPFILCNEPAGRRAALKLLPLFSDPWFTAILFRGYLDLYALDKNDTYINTVIKNVDYAWENARNGNGFFYEDWSGKKTGRDYWILNQTCMVEIYARISTFRNE